MYSDRDTHRMTVWPEHTSLSRRKNTIGSSCKADRFFPVQRSRQLATGRDGANSPARKTSFSITQCGRMKRRHTYLDLALAYLYLHRAYVLTKGMLGEPWRKQELGRLTAAACCLNSCCWALEEAARLSLGCTAHACVRSPRHKCSSALNTISWISLFMVLPA